MYVEMTSLILQSLYLLMYNDLPQIRPVDEDFGPLCAVNHRYAWNLHRVLQVLIDRVGYEHEVCLAGADISETDKCRV